MPQGSDPRKPIYEAWLVCQDPETKVRVRGVSCLGIRVDRHEYTPSKSEARTADYTQAELAALHLAAIDAHHARGAAPWACGLPVGRWLHRSGGGRGRGSYEHDVDARLRATPLAVREEVMYLLAAREHATYTPWRSRDWTVAVFREQLCHSFARVRPEPARRHRWRRWRDNVGGQPTEFLVVLRGFESRSTDDPAGFRDYYRESNPWKHHDAAEKRARAGPTPRFPRRQPPTAPYLPHVPPPPPGAPRPFPARPPAPPAQVPAPVPGRPDYRYPMYAPARGPSEYRPPLYAPTHPRPMAPGGLPPHHPVPPPAAGPRPYHPGAHWTPPPTGVFGMNPIPPPPPPFAPSPFAPRPYYDLPYPPVWNHPPYQPPVTPASARVCELRGPPPPPPPPPAYPAAFPQTSPGVQTFGAPAPYQWSCSVARNTCPPPGSAPRPGPPVGGLPPPLPNGPAVILPARAAVTPVPPSPPHPTKTPSVPELASAPNVKGVEDSVKLGGPEAKSLEEDMK